MHSIHNSTFKNVPHDHFSILTYWGHFDDFPMITPHGMCLVVCTCGCAACPVLLFSRWRVGAWRFLAIFCNISCLPYLVVSGPSDAVAVAGDAHRHRAPHPRSWTSWWQRYPAISLCWCGCDLHYGHHNEHRAYQLIQYWWWIQPLIIIICSKPVLHHVFVMLKLR